MCNLYASTMPRDAMISLFSAHDRLNRLGNARPLPAIFPKGTAPIVRLEAGERELVRSHWGYLTPNKSKKTGNWIKPRAWNNSRDDSLQTASLWKESFQKRRCLVPATSYAEATGRNPATWHWFRPEGASGFAFAGIWKQQGPVPGAEETDTIAHSVVTTSPNDFLAQYHNRMPVILPEQVWDTWLTGSETEAASVIEPFEGPLEVIGSGTDQKSEPGTTED